MVTSHRTVYYNSIYRTANEAGDVIFMAANKSLRERTNARHIVCSLLENNENNKNSKDKSDMKSIM